MSEDAEPQKPKRRGLTAAERMAQWRLRHQTKPFPPLLAPSIKLDRLAASAKETLAVYDRLVAVIGNGLSQWEHSAGPRALARTRKGGMGGGVGVWSVHGRCVVGQRENADQRRP